jgi:hypothetical protein
MRASFNSKQKHIGIFEGRKEVARYDIDDLSDIYAHSEQIGAQAALLRG